MKPMNLSGFRLLAWRVGADLTVNANLPGDDESQWLSDPCAPNLPFGDKSPCRHRWIYPAVYRVSDGPLPCGPSDTRCTTGYIHRWPVCIVLRIMRRAGVHQFSVFDTPVPGRAVLRWG
jgi:hypothetical protein